MVTLSPRYSSIRWSPSAAPFDFARDPQPRTAGHLDGVLHLNPQLTIGLDHNPHPDAGDTKKNNIKLDTVNHAMAPLSAVLSITKSREATSYHRISTIANRNLTHNRREEPLWGWSVQPAAKALVKLHRQVSFRCGAIILGNSSSLL